MGVSCRRMFSTFFVALLLLVATDAGIEPNVMVTDHEARPCESYSMKYEGMCSRHKRQYCSTVCQTEGYSRGDCRGVHNICVCTKHC